MKGYISQLPVETVETSVTVSNCPTTIIFMASVHGLQKQRLQNLASDGASVGRAI